MSRRNVIVVLAVLAMLLAPTAVLAGKGRGGPSAQADSPVTCNLPESDADGLEILSTYYPATGGTTPI